MRSSMVLGRYLRMIGQSSLEFAFRGGTAAFFLLSHEFVDLFAPIFHFYATLKRFFQRKLNRKTESVIQLKQVCTCNFLNILCDLNSRPASHNSFKFSQALAKR